MPRSGARRKLGPDCRALPLGPDTGGLGLVSMRERARLIGGTLSISSTPGQGTLVTLELPLESIEH